MKRRAFACALLLALATTAHAGNYNFDYTTDGGNVMGIDRVFDDGRNTVVAFYGPLGYERPTVTTAAGQVLPYRVNGRYLILPDIQRHVLVYARGVVAQVIHGRPPALQLPSPYQVPPAQPTPAPYVPAPTATVPTPPSTLPGSTALAHAPATPAPAPVPAVAQLPAAPAAAMADDEESRFVVSDELPPPPPKPRWAANAGASLRNTTEQWASRAGWKVYWHLSDGADYETLATTAEGEFLTALRELYAPYLQAHGDKPVRVAAYPRQKVLVISE